MLADEFELDATQLQEFSDSNNSNTGSEYSQPQTKKKRGRPTRMKEEKTKDEMDIGHCMMKQDDSEVKLKKQQKKEEDTFDYKGAWLDFLKELGPLTYREWAHLKDKNLMCVWMHNLKQAKGKHLVFMYRKKMQVRDELDKVNKQYARDNPGLPQRYYDKLN
jgi:hypothetical protein